MQTKVLAQVFLAFLLLSSCASSKKITYFQDIGSVSMQAEVVNYETKIKCDDELSILVSGPDMGIVQSYNLNMTPTYTGGSSFGTTPEMMTQTSDVGYRVDSKGEINFPVLGKIKVEGITRSDLVEYLTTEISKDIKNPVVTVTMTNFNITIIGDVGSPGNYRFDTDKVNVIQAIAEAGDISLTAVMDDIVLVRKINGRQTYTILDMTSKNILESENFYLQQNDILYVKPDPSKIAQKNDPLRIWSVVLSSITSILAIASFFL